SLPPGWSALWDPAGQRWAYLELWNSKIDWTVPTSASLGGGGGHEDGTRGFDDGHSGGHGYPAAGYAGGGGYPPQGGYPAQGGYPPQGGYGGQQGMGHDAYGAQGAYGADLEKEKKKEKDDDKKKMMMGAAAGVAVGAVGGALLMNALGTSFIASFSPFPLSIPPPFPLTPHPL
ncbi:hypothetical protein V493_07556, partial [Pseudogymnoascus sp. VKM F-4281 (FW-2241)]